jgi:hypothetical protein
VVLGVMQNPQVMDYVIAVLMSKFSVSLDKIIGVFGYQLIESWLEELASLESLQSTSGYESFVLDFK